MYVDQSRSDIQAGDIDHFQRVGGIQMRGDGRDKSIFDGDIADCADVILRIDDMPALQE